jgi:hypothetical protein
MQSAADEIRSMADRLKDIEDKDELNLETYDNTPADPTNVPAFDANKMALNTNAGGVNKGITNAPSAMAEDLEDQLYSEYKKFVSESKFEKLEKKLAAKGATNPGGLAKWIGDKKYGKKTMEKKAAAGRK